MVIKASESGTFVDREYSGAVNDVSFARRPLSWSSSNLHKAKAEGRTDAKLSLNTHLELVHDYARICSEVKIGGGRKGYVRSVSSY